MKPQTFGVIAAAAMMLFALPPSSIAAETDDAAIRPFRIRCRRNIAPIFAGALLRPGGLTKKPSRTSSRVSQLAEIKELVRYWASGYDWRKGKRNSTRCRSSSPTSTASTFT